MSVDPKVTDELRETVIRVARAFTRCAAEFPDDPSIWVERLEHLNEAMAALDARLDEEFARRVA